MNESMNGILWRDAAPWWGNKHFYENGKAARKYCHLCGGKQSDSDNLGKKHLSQGGKLNDTQFWYPEMQIQYKEESLPKVSPRTRSIRETSMDSLHFYKLCEAHRPFMVSAEYRHLRSKSWKISLITGTINSSVLLLKDHLH